MTARDLLLALCAAFPAVPASGQGGAWPLRIQSELSARVEGFPSPPPRDEWRAEPLRVAPGASTRDMLLTLPLLAEITGILGSDADPRHRRDGILRRTADVLSECGPMRTISALALAANGHRAMLATDDPAREWIALSMSTACALAAAHLALADAIGGAPVAWHGGRYGALSLDPEIPDLPDALGALHALSVVQRMAHISSLSGDGELKNVPDPGPFVLRDAVCLDDYGFGTGLLAAICAPHDGKRTRPGSRRLAVDAACGMMRQGFALHDKLFRLAVAGLPQLPPSWDLRREAVENAAFALWPGVTEVQWEEDRLHGLLLCGTRHGVLCNVASHADLSSLFGPEASDVLVQRWAEIPALDSDHDWIAARENAEACGYDELAVPMEALRMCLVPRVFANLKGTHLEGKCSPERGPPRARSSIILQEGTNPLAGGDERRCTGWSTRSLSARSTFWKAGPSDGFRNNWR